MCDWTRLDRLIQYVESKSGSRKRLAMAHSFFGERRQEKECVRKVPLPGF